MVHPCGSAYCMKKKNNLANLLREYLGAMFWIMLPPWIYVQLYVPSTTPICGSGPQRTVL